MGEVNEAYEQAQNHEKEIQYLIDSIETMDDRLKNVKELKASLLNSLFDYYYENDFNGATLEYGYGELNFLVIDKTNNMQRIIRLLSEFKGINDDNKHKIAIALKVIDKINSDYSKLVSSTYEEVRASHL